METIFYSILLVIVGLFLGAGVVIIYNKIKIANAQNEADKLIDNAKKESEKIKRDGILELKEESYRIKTETENEIKEKKKVN